MEHNKEETKEVDGRGRVQVSKAIREVYNMHNGKDIVTFDLTEIVHKTKPELGVTNLVKEHSCYIDSRGRLQISGTLREAYNIMPGDFVTYRVKDVTPKDNA